MKTIRYTARLVIAAFGICLSLTVGSCASLDQKAAAPVTVQQFATGWQEHSRPLLFHGPGLAPGTTDWLVPNILPRGSYRVIRREGDHAELMDGYRFTIDSDSEKEIHLMMFSSETGLEALDEKYIPGLDSAGAKI